VQSAELDAVLLAGVGELLEHVPLEWRVADVVVRVLRRPDAESVVVLGGDDEVLRAGGFGHPDPLLGVERSRVEALVELVVFLDRHLRATRPADLRALEAHRPPMNEQPELHDIALCCCS